MGKIVAGITIGQAPRVDMTGDILPILPPDAILKEYGALDDFTADEIRTRFAPGPGDEVLVSRLRDASQAVLAERHVPPLVQRAIDRAEAEGARLILLLCTGTFPPFRHEIPLIEPQKLFRFTAKCLADGARVGVLVPLKAQQEQVRGWWAASGVEAEAESASPYLEADGIEAAAARFRGRGLKFLCMDCMGYSVAMKRAAERGSGLEVLLPRTLIAAAARAYL